MNTHEIATISGLAVAHRLGAPYPFVHDKLARMQFETYMSAIHGVGFVRKASAYGIIVVVGFVVFYVLMNQIA